MLTVFSVSMLGVLAGLTLFLDVLRADVRRR